MNLADFEGGIGQEFLRDAEYERDPHQESGQGCEYEDEPGEDAAAEDGEPALAAQEEKGCAK
jgi:hypothetical protein